MGRDVQVRWTGAEAGPVLTAVGAGRGWREACGAGAEPTSARAVCKPLTSSLVFSLPCGHRGADSLNIYCVPAPCPAIVGISTIEGHMVFQVFDVNKLINVSRPRQNSPHFTHEETEVQRS